MYSMGPPKWSHAWTCSQELGIPRNIGLAECPAAKKIFTYTKEDDIDTRSISLLLNSEKMEKINVYFLFIF